MEMAESRLSALITDAQNASPRYTITRHPLGRFSAEAWDWIAQRVGNEYSRGQIDVAKLFNRLRNRWRVNQRCHFFDWSTMSL